MDGYNSRRNQSSRARERQMARQRRSSTTAPLKEAITGRLSGIDISRVNTGWHTRAGYVLRDLAWYVTHTPIVMMGIGALAALLFVIFVATHLFQGRIFPNVWALGINIGDLTVEEAAAVLNQHWETSFQLEIVDDQRTWYATPKQLGLRLNAIKIAENARGVGLSGIPMGYGIPPVAEMDFNTAQNYLLDMTTVTDVPPNNASYQIQDGQVIGVNGKEGRALDVAATMDTLADLTGVVQNRRFNLTMETILPDYFDPEPYLATVQNIASQNISLSGYDPFTDQTVTWSTTPDVFVSWLEVGNGGLALREEAYAAFFNAQNQSISSGPGQQVRYLDPRETSDLLTEAIRTQQTNVTLRIRYRDTKYEVVRGDTAYRISRKTGIPFYLIQEANPGRNLDILSPGDLLNLPSKDLAVPLNPVPNKRIVVDLDTQSLIAFENGQPVFNWLISSGMSQYPTSPGVYQILNHDPEASGGSFTLCNDQGYNCGSWEMYWFMGMYEVVPGLMNGFHGAVLLPNGNLLGGGSVGSPYTFGCVMSNNDNAKLLYDWADEGTVVEIISSEFAPQSPLGEMARSRVFNPNGL
ncbi:MAG: L,D-transpeptidase family protein [Anaerolineae bacterium]|nr:L,D-transpeptidase family protein [Anaerolineae bacterium]